MVQLFATVFGLCGVGGVNMVSSSAAPEADEMNGGGDSSGEDGEVRPIGEVCWS
jgi:hypothetical protein